MKKLLNLLIILSLISTASYIDPASAQTYQPVTVTGFNTDVVVNGTTDDPSSTVSGPYYGFDNGGNTFISQDFFYSGTSPSGYLPTGGVLTSLTTTGLTYQLASYSDYNSLVLLNNSGTLTFTTPVSAFNVYLLGATGSLASSVETATFTVNFTDASTQTGATYDYPDWFGLLYTYLGGSPPPFEVVVGERFALPSSFDDTHPGEPGLYAGSIAISPGNLNKLISSITVSASGIGYLNIMAVSVQPLLPVTGAGSVCIGSSITLSDGVAGGTWSSSNTGIASVSTAGVVTGISTGTATISYSFIPGGYATAVVTVDPFAGTISGPAIVDNGATISLTDASPTGGAWSSANTTIASVDPSSGVVTGGAVGGGNTIYYTISNSCGTAKASYIIHVYSSVCNCY